MADRAKHAHGSRSNLSAAIASGKVNEFDVLFLSGKDENPALGWVDKYGNPIIISPTDEVSKLETKLESEIASKANADEVEAAIATKADAQEVETKLSTKADTSDVEALEEQVATKVTTEEVKMMIKESEDSFVEIVEF